jgi:hypothetical protein
MRPEADLRCGLPAPEKAILEFVIVSGAFEGRAARRCISWITVGGSEHVQ